MDGHSSLAAVAVTTEATPRRGGTYLLVALTLFYTSNFIDRAILNILSQPIKDDLGLTDAQIGLLGGLAFSFFYAGLSIPIARLAERRNRVGIISAALAFWSLMTMACAFAGNFAQLALARAGVGIGEAACTPCAHSLIADSFPPNRRATAMSIYSLGIPFGTLLGVLGGAWIASLYGWRTAFLVVGAPGLLLALIARLTIAEPERGRFDPPSAPEAPPFSAVLRHLFRRRTFVHMLIGVAVSTMASAGILAFISIFLLRGPYQLDLKGVALVMAITTGIAATTGTAFGGALTDALAHRNRRFYLWLPAAAFALSAPLYVASLLQSSVVGMVGFALVAQFLGLLYLGPTFGVLHNMVEPRMRASAVAIVFVLTSLVGLGLGPVLVGTLSDWFADLAFGGEFATACNAAQAAQSEACRAASFTGLRYALIVDVLIYLWAAAHYALASRTLLQDELH